MAGHRYEYTIHIRATTERVWDALTTNDDWQVWWNEWQIASTWREGADIHFRNDGTLYSTGKILKIERGKTLAFSWPNMPAEPNEIPEHLSWEIRRTGPDVAGLTLIHANLTKENLDGVSGGWPAILSSFKSYLETGSPLVFDEGENNAEDQP